MELVIPASCDTPRAQALYAHRMMRLVEERHNAMGAQARAGTLPMRDFLGWKSAVWRPVRRAVGIRCAVLKLACFPRLSEEIERDEAHPVHADRLELKTTGRETADWDDSPEARALVRALAQAALEGTFADPTEDLTTFTEVDENDDITVTSARATATAMRLDALSYVTKDYGTGHFGDYEHLFTVDVSATGGDGFRAYSHAVGNGLSGANAWTTGQACYHIRYSSGSYRVAYREYDGGVSTDEAVYSTTSPVCTHYVTMARSGTTGTCDVYSDSARTTLISGGALSLTVATTTYRYGYALASYDYNSPPYNAYTGTWFVEDLDLQGAAAQPMPIVSGAGIHAAHFHGLVVSG
jgi:hypothetical protein